MLVDCADSYGIFARKIQNDILFFSSTITTAVVDIRDLGRANRYECSEAASHMRDYYMCDRKSKRWIHCCSRTDGGLLLVKTNCIAVM